MTARPHVEREPCSSIASLQLAAFVTAYLVALAVADRHLDGEWKSAFSWATSLAGGVAFAMVLRKGGWSRADLGLVLVTHGWRRATRDAVASSLPLLAVLVFVKAWLVRPGSPLEQESIFRFPPAWAMTFYPAHVVLQELLVRGYLLGALERSWPGRRGKLSALIASSLVFGLGHLHFSLAFAILNAALGVLWGHLLRTHRTLVAPAVSHFLIGTCAILLDGMRILGS